MRQLAESSVSSHLLLIALRSGNKKFNIFEAQTSVSQLFDTRARQDIRFQVKVSPAFRDKSKPPQG